MTISAATTLAGLQPARGGPCRERVDEPETMTEVGVGVQWLLAPY